MAMFMAQFIIAFKESTRLFHFSLLNITKGLNVSLISLYFHCVFFVIVNNFIFLLNSLPYLKGNLNGKVTDDMTVSFCCFLLLLCWLLDLINFLRTSTMFRIRTIINLSVKIYVEQYGDVALI